MKEELSEDILKEILYEVSTEDMLRAYSRRKRRRRILLGFVFIVVICVISFWLHNRTSSVLEERKQWVVELYQFPEFVASRGATPSIVMENADLLEAKDYDKLLAIISSSSSIEPEDLYWKAHLEYELGYHTDAVESIADYPISSTGYEDMLWLKFLIDYESGLSRNELTRTYEDLSAEYQRKAFILLERLKK